MTKPVHSSAGCSGTTPSSYTVWAGAHFERGHLVERPEGKAA
ncbi:hypothetical protein [Streptomyces beijiangensis]|nr:hypothetical protein [Streptomyces beijiangensis]